MRWEDHKDQKNEWLMDLDLLKKGCVICGKVGGHLVYHHVYGRAVDMKTVVPMCDWCESAVHGEVRSREGFEAAVLEWRAKLPANTVHNPLRKRLYPGGPREGYADPPEGWQMKPKRRGGNNPTTIPRAPEYVPVVVELPPLDFWQARRERNKERYRKGRGPARTKAAEPRVEMDHWKFEKWDSQ